MPLFGLNKSLKVSENFVQQVKYKVNKICHSLFRYSKIYKHFRETPLRKYPYLLVYFFDEDKKLVVVTSVFHHKRNLRKKYLK